MDISIIIVNWNSSDYLGKCLSSIHENTDGPGFEVIVIDNASYDGSAEMVGKEFPRVRFVQSDKNLGFAGANNAAFEHSTGDAVLFLNPDTVIVGDAIKVMHGHLHSLPGAGAVGCRLLNSDRTLQTSCVQPFPTLLNQMLNIGILKARTRDLKLWGKSALFQNSGRPEQVEVVSGAAVMVKRDLFERVGRFTEDYFMYTEDIDLCYKLLHAGFRVYHVNDAVIIHHGGGSSKRTVVSHTSAVWMRQSIHTFFHMRKGRSAARLYRLSMAVAAVPRMLIMRVLMKRDRGGSVYFEKTFDKWDAILRWSLGMEPRGMGGMAPRGERSPLVPKASYSEE